MVDRVATCYDLGIISLIFPLKVLIFLLFKFLTKRDYSFMKADLCDLGIAICMGIWIYQVNTWRNDPNDEEGYA